MLHWALEHNTTRAYVGPLECHWDQLGSAQSRALPNAAALLTSSKGLLLRRTAEEAGPDFPEEGGYLKGVFACIGCYYHMGGAEEKGVCVCVCGHLLHPGLC